MKAAMAQGKPAPYTAWGDETIDLHIDEMLQRIVQMVVQQMGTDLSAALLCGGFGRGEGGVLRLAHGGLHVVNDFDIELVYREPLGRALSKLVMQLKHRRALAGLADQLAHQLDMKQIDLTLRGQGSFGQLAPSLANHDGLYGHRLLHGEVDPFQLSEALPASDIDRFEGTWLLRNRAVGLVLARLYLDQPGGLRQADRENFFIEINKSVLAVGDALYLLCGRYHVSYEKRKEDFGTLREFEFPWFNELSELYDEAAENKLRPTSDPYSAREPEHLWRDVSRLHVRAFLWYESQRLQYRFQNIEQWQRLQLSNARRGLKGQLLAWVRRRMERLLGATGHCPRSMTGLRQDKLASVACAIALLDARAAPDASNGAEEAWRVLAHWPMDDAPVADWSPLGSAAEHTWCLQARGLLAALHPSGEVGRFLARTRAAS